jgi:hypothetical protein
MRRIFVSSMLIISIVLISFKSFGQSADIIVSPGGLSSEYMCKNSHVLSPTFVNFMRLLFAKPKSYDRIMQNFGYSYSDYTVQTSGYFDSCSYFIQRNTDRAYVDKSGHDKTAETSVSISYVKNDGYLNSILYDMRTILLNKAVPSVDECGVQTYYLNVQYLSFPLAKTVISYDREKITFLLIEYL